MTFGLWVLLTGVAFGAVFGAVAGLLVAAALVFPLVIENVAGRWS